MANRAFMLNLSSPTGGKIARATATATVIDSLKAVPSLSVGNVAVSRLASGSTVATFLVTLSAASTQTISVKFATSNGTALAGTDYTAQSGTLTFAPGVTQMKITVPILANNNRKGAFTFNVLLSSPLNALLVGSTGIGTINNPTTTSPTSTNGQVQATTVVGPPVLRLS